MERLKEKVAVVTGAANGIGLAIAKAFVSEGGVVVMADINFEKCSLEAHELKKAGFNALPFKCDVGDPEDVQSLINFTLGTFGKIDVLVNNAAVAKHYDITKMTEEEWDELTNTNLKSVFRGIKGVLPAMIEQKSGNIITLSSVQAHRSWNDWNAYAGAKGAIMAMTNQLAGQYGMHNIRFNTISPGAILTPLNEARIKEEGEEFRAKSELQSALKRIGNPNEVAMAALFLASDEASFITGVDLIVDGGLCTLPRYL